MMVDLEAFEIRGPEKVLEMSIIATISNTRFLTTRKFHKYWECMACDKPIIVTSSVPDVLICQDPECSARNTVEFMEMGVSLEGMVKVDGSRVWL